MASINSYLLPVFLFGAGIVFLLGPAVVLIAAEEYLPQSPKWSWANFFKAWAMFCVMKWIVLASLAILSEPGILAYFSVVSLFPEIAILPLIVNIRTVSYSHWVHVLFPLSFVTSALLAAGVTRLKKR